MECIKIAINQDLVQSIKEQIITPKIIPIEYKNTRIGIANVDKITDEGICYTGDIELDGGRVPIYWSNVLIPPGKESDTNNIIAKIYSNIRDTLLLKGTNNVKGIMSFAGNIVTDPADFLTCGNATKTIIKARWLLHKGGYGLSQKANLILNPVQYLELFTQPSTGLPDWYNLQHLLCDGKIYQTQAIQQGQGLLIPTIENNRDYFKVKDNLDFDLFKMGNNKWRMLFSVDPIQIKDPNMICRLDYI